LEDYFDGVFDSVSDANAFIKRNWDTYAKPFSPNDFVGHRVSHRDGVDFTYTLIEVKK
jgi:hypothetical protein